VAHNSNDLGLHIELRQIDVLPDGIFARKVGSRKHIVDVDHDRRVLVVS
jgi:hypothetical protein